MLKKPRPRFLSWCLEPGGCRDQADKKRRYKYEMGYKVKTCNVRQADEVLDEV
jgi:hypothetical protein